MHSAPAPHEASGDTHQPGVGHCLELQEEDPLLARLAGCASHGGAAVVGQEKAVAFAPGPAHSGDILLAWVRQVSHNFTPLLHQSAHGDLKDSDVCAGLKGNHKEGSPRTPRAAKCQTKSFVGLGAGYAPAPRGSGSFKQSFYNIRVTQSTWKTLGQSHSGPLTGECPQG